MEFSEPGTLIDDPVPSIACACLNDLKTHVVIPVAVIDAVKKNSGVIEPLWPLGVYVGFTEEGITLGVYGRKEGGEVVHGVAQQAITEKEPPPMGEIIWDLWKKLRRAPYSLTYVMFGNFNALKNETHVRHKLGAPS
jgi:hypothetical protein